MKLPIPPTGGQGGHYGHGAGMRTRTLRTKAKASGHRRVPRRWRGLRLRRRKPSRVGSESPLATLMVFAILAFPLSLIAYGIFQAAQVFFSVPTGGP